MTRIVITGAKGRMGKALIACAARIPNLQITGQIDLGDDIESLLHGCDVVVDFSFHDATAPLAKLCAKHSKALVIGTTGHNESEKETILGYTKSIPVVWASNYSTGINTLFWLVRKASEALGPNFDIEIIEMHHRLKKDAPSGTAGTLAEILAETRKQQLAEVVRHGREGIVGARTQSEIGMHSIRGGDVVGDHTVIFANNGERLELTHKASSRETFANGALHAAQWVIGKPAGLYNMQDILGLK
jgi:4-hydroxy-tetrahydrodipicolinate reductase